MDTFLTALKCRVRGEKDLSSVDSLAKWILWIYFNSSKSEYYIFKESSDSKKIALS